MEVPVELAILGVERAADTTTVANFEDMLGMVQQLPIEFRAQYAKRLQSRVGFELAPAWMRNRLVKG